MLKKGTKLYSIFKEKCPKCHQGDFFKYRFTFHPSKITKLHENCPTCNLKYMMEPSFFFGAMYVNYALAVAIAVISFIVFKLAIQLSFLYSLIATFAVLVVSAPYFLRLSRIIWINLFVSYENKERKK